MENQSIKNDRIDIRVTPEEKEIFHRACLLSGDRSLSTFVTRIVKSRANKIIEENENILASKKDKKIFFDAVFSDSEPNQKLKKAAGKYKSLKDNR